MNDAVSSHDFDAALKLHSEDGVGFTECCCRPESLLAERVREGDKEAVLFLLAQGEDPNYILWECSAIEVAVSSPSCDPDMLVALLEHGGDVNAVSSQGGTIAGYLKLWRGDQAEAQCRALEDFMDRPGGPGHASIRWTL